MRFLSSILDQSLPWPNSYSQAKEQSSATSGARGNSSISGSVPYLSATRTFGLRRRTVSYLRSQLLQLDLTDEKRALLMQAYLTMKAWPDVPEAVGALKQSGIRLALLSNMTSKMLNANIESAGLQHVFEAVLSTDDVRSYKPDPRAYKMAVEALGLKREEILFAPFAGWDASGAKWFGYPTFWVNRFDMPLEKLGIAPDATGRNLSDLARFASSS